MDRQRARNKLNGPITKVPLSPEGIASVSWSFLFLHINFDKQASITPLIKIVPPGHGNLTVGRPGNDLSKFIVLILIYCSTGLGLGRLRRKTALHFPYFLFKLAIVQTAVRQQRRECRARHQRSQSGGQPRERNKCARPPCKSPINHH